MSTYWQNWKNFCHLSQEGQLLQTIDGSSVKFICKYNKKIVATNSFGITEFQSSTSTDKLNKTDPQIIKQIHAYITVQASTTITAVISFPISSSHLFPMDFLDFLISLQLLCSNSSSDIFLSSFKLVSSISVVILGLAQW
jgi:hypothetical protein